MGSFYHGKANVEDDWTDNENKIKVWKTRSGNHIQMVDEEGKEQIRIFNKDFKKPKNEIVLTLEGDGKITITTEGDLEMKAKNIKMEADEEITVKSGNDTKFEADNFDVKATTKHSTEAQEVAIKGSAKAELETLDLKMKSTQAEISADAQMKLKASAMMDIDGGGMANLKGGIVKIN